MILKKTFIKTVLRDLKKNLTRFIAIIAIVALGVGFLIGLLSATPDLKHSADVFYDEQNTYDILVKSTIGFSKKDIEDLKSDLDGVDEIEGYYQKDFTFEQDNKEVTARKIDFDQNQIINQLKLVAGRFPDNELECLVLNKGIYWNDFHLEEEIQLEDRTIKIVGACESSVYFYKLLEPTQIGNGNLDAIFYVPKTNDLITDVVLTVSSTKNMSCFDNAYFDAVREVEKQLEEKSESYLNRRYEEIKEANIQEAVLKAKEQMKALGMSDEMIEVEIEKRYSLISAAVEEEMKKNMLEPEWYILNRKSNTSYVTFNDNADKVNDVAVVFPFFFFFIAGLIALTSVTRMVSEDRGSIGTLKSLGYSNASILKKYLFYALFACLIGSFVGIITGVYILPVVIYKCYESLFVMPTAHYLWSAPIILLSSLTMSLTIVLVMCILCVKTLKERPNALMVPKAPKAGKRILFERIGFLWKHLKFRYKSAIRNIFRFKRNLIMMMVGIGGCTGLMLVAFGLKDSMNSFSKKQYDEILNYDFILEANDMTSFPMLTDSQMTNIEKQTGTMKKDSAYEVTILYGTSNIINFIDLKTELPLTGVMISKQLAKEFNCKKGSTIEVQVHNEIKTYMVEGIFENYIGNYIISYAENPNTNAWLVKLGEQDTKDYDTIVKEIYSQESITKVEDIRQIRKNYDSMSDNIQIIIYVIILCSGALAVIVIYNLTNINIDERIKEIATLKVIGYQKIEVLGYIYKEILMMSVLGILVGFVIGPLLDYFVMDRISGPGQYFAMMLSWEHFLYSFLITLFFVFVVFLLFIPKVKKIKMVESLKCVE